MNRQWQAAVGLSVRMMTLSVARGVKNWPEFRRQYTNVQATREYLEQLEDEESSGE